MKRVLLAVLAAALLLGACGDDGDSNVLGGGSNGGGSNGESTTTINPDDLDDDERRVADRLASSIKLNPDAPPISDEQAECVGATMVKKLGADRAEELDLDDDVSLSEDEARSVAEAMVGCVDVRPLLVEGMTEDGEITNEQATCLSRELSDDEIVSLLTGAFADGDDFEVDPSLFEPLADAMLNCMDFGAELVEQFTAGGNLSAESANCLAGAISDDLLRDLIVAGMSDGDTSAAQAAFTREILSVAPDCLTDEELARMGQ